VFEPVHGSAPDIARKGIANPLACIMSGVMMLNHLGETAAAARIREAYDAVLGEHNPEKRTPDIGGTASTQQFTDAIIQAMK
jgi:homoisocitrate dehydrogenase